MKQGKILFVATILTIVFVMAMNIASRAQGAPPTPQVQALQQKLLQELNASLQCSEAALTLQQQLATANSEITQLKAKYEPPKKEEPKK